jgi:tetraacyldisaccharide 4'-kinase
VAETVDFPDHYPYTEEDIKTLNFKAIHHGAELITTEKDFIRLPKAPGFHPHVLKIKLEWDNEDAIADFIRSRLQAP